MDSYKFCLIDLLVICGCLLCIDAQSGYGRRRVISPRVYPRSHPISDGVYPVSGGLYPGSGGLYPGSGGLYPASGGLYPGSGGLYPSGEVISTGVGSSWSQRSALRPSGVIVPSYDGSVLHPAELRDTGVPFVSGGVVSGGVPLAHGAIPVQTLPVVSDRRPNIVDDRSGRTALNINVHNENNNVHDQAGSGRVTVTQDRHTNRCRTPCDVMGQCPHFQVCVPNSDCPNNYGCQ